MQADNTARLYVIGMDGTTPTWDKGEEDNNSNQGPTLLLWLRLRTIRASTKEVCAFSDLYLRRQPSWLHEGLEDGNLRAATGHNVH